MPAAHRCSAGIKIPCSEGSYNDQPGMISMGACSSCPSDSTSPEASTTIADCRCNEGYYDELSDSANVSCVRMVM